MSNVNLCVCCGEVIPEGRQVCPTCNKVVDSCTNLGNSYTVSPKELKEAFARHGTGDALARGFAEGIENPRTDDGFYIDDMDFSSINKLLSIHKIIDDAMEKRDRTVSIFISAENNAVSVNVYPVNHDEVYWKADPDGLICTNCGFQDQSYSKYTYCPDCGELMHGIR